jgi:hypothetical protein
MLKIKDCCDKLQGLGRIYEGPEGELYMNWTCSGLRFKFKGTYLAAELSAMAGEELDRDPFFGTTKNRETWPFAAVFIDGKEEASRRFEINDTEKNYLLFASEKEEEHIIEIRKLTENPKGKLSIRKFLTDGTIENAEENQDKLNIEFIGDSITCGFGNSTKERDRLFFSADEDGWMSHAAIAARKLKAQFSIISYSGIAITKGKEILPWMPPSMPELYPYTDKLIEEKLGIKDSFRKWEFEKQRQDVIVLNLGTNDAAVIEFNKDIPNGIKKFEEDYYQFLKMLRTYNGKTPWIICTLGSMDYFLYDNIEKTAERFSKENDDQKIRCFKYGRIQFMDGYGACGHPNVTTQTKMGNEIAAYISELLK